jgi:predicted dinucleotide-binding enzyme
MHIAVLGTGSVGRTLARGLAGVGHSVVVGTRDPAQTRRREDWLAADDISLDTFAEAAAGGEVIVNATNGAASLSVLGDAGVDNLAGKVVLDVANPLDSSQGFPPTLSVKDTDSLAEQIQRAFPEARVVKSLNTMNAAVMVAPDSVGDGDTSVFVAGNDDAARAVVVGLLRDLGWRDIIDLGDLTGARGMEMWLPLWLRLMTTLGGAAFNLRIVR